MRKEIIELTENVSNSPLCSEDLSPVPVSKRNWTTWNLAAIWVGMAVCIPTYLLASYMITTGLNWLEALIIIGLANLIITIPMVLNGHPGVKFGIPFPVIGRAAFGFKGVHIPSITRAIVACGWFGVQRLAFYAIFCAAFGTSPALGLSFGKFIGFALFWLLNMYFIWKGTESIKWLEQYSAPILIAIGLVLIGWGTKQTGGFSKVLKESKQLERSAAEFIINGQSASIQLNPIKDKDGKVNATEYRFIENGSEGEWTPIVESFPVSNYSLENSYEVKLRNSETESSKATVNHPQDSGGTNSKLWTYILWLTAMVGFWATMSISIADITRYASSQKSQVVGQFIGLPGTMMLYSFVGIFVTCAAVLNFNDILIVNDAPWDPVTLLVKFESPTVVIIAQIFMIIATLSTNIAANVIAPSNAFSNLLPKKISFRGGGLITGIIGILIAPWWLLDEISNILIFVSGLLGPVLGILICDYFITRSKTLRLAELYKENSLYNYTAGFNMSAMISLFLGVLVAIIGFFIPALDALYKLSWFSGFIVSFVVYYTLMRNKEI
jgi:cytosine/uracil/thiamine/allantoin permease